MSKSRPRTNATMIAPASADKDAARPTNSLLFEVAWEVCAKVGGIYTVLRSKVPATVRRWGDAYCLVGPYREASAQIEVEPQAPPDILKAGMDKLIVSGVRVHFGRWLVTGRPQVVLIDVQSLMYRAGEIKYLLWRDCGVGSPGGDIEFDEVATFGFAVADFLSTVQQKVGERPMLAHFHEWQGGAALPLLKHRQSRIATVFTTHATLSGRNLCAANANIYDHLPAINAGAVAAEHGYAHRHAMEGSAAQSADVFTTVSGITAMEAEHFLGRRPDVLLPNGLNVERFAAPHEFQLMHRSAKQVIHRFVMGHFFPSYTFDLDRTLYVFTAGRYEYRNKGLDMFIESLYELNRRMKAEHSPVTVVAFIIARVPHRSFNIQALNRQAMFTELRETCERIKEDMGQRLFDIAATGRLPTIDELLDESAIVRLKRMMYAWRSSPPPSIVTHDLLDDAHDQVLCHLRHRGLWNLEEDRVKVVFHPDFLSATSPLLAMEYDEFIRGCHIGVFPSYYEPWGYTPLECIVSGIPAITTDLSGFGHYVMEHFPDHDERGMYIVQRHGVPYHQCVNHITDRLHQLTQMSRRERIALRNRAESSAEHFDWTYLGRHYATAQRLALERRYTGHDLVPADPALAKETRDGQRRGKRRAAGTRRRGTTSRH